MGVRERWDWRLVSYMHASVAKLSHSCSFVQFQQTLSGSTQAQPFLNGFAARFQEAHQACAL